MNLIPESLVTGVKFDSKASIHSWNRERKGNQLLHESFGTKS